MRAASVVTGRWSAAAPARSGATASFVEARPSPWRQAVDLANMMLCLALRSRPERVYQRALGQFSIEEITEGFAAASGLALPSQLRRLLREQGRDLHAEFVKLLPSPPQPIRVQRWSVRRVGLWVFVAALLVLAGASVVNAVANNEANATPLHVGTLACSDPEPLWLEAQSVPSASLVPCLRSLPIGWTLEKATVNDGRSVLTLNHDRAGTSAAVVRLTATCSPVGAAQVPSDQPGARRYLRIERLAPEFSATRFDVFTGGCVTTRLNAPAAHRAQLTSDATSLLGFTTRQALQQTLEQRSNGRLQLDPPQRP